MPIPIKRYQQLQYNPKKNRTDSSPNEMCNQSSEGIKQKLKIGNLNRLHRYESRTRRKRLRPHIKLQAPPAGVSRRFVLRKHLLDDNVHEQVNTTASLVTVLTYRSGSKR